MTAVPAVVGRPRSPGWGAAPWGLGAGAVLCQVAYPLVGGAARARLTVATVVLFAAASLAHAALSRGVRWAAALLLIAGGGGLAAEAVGVATGWPFGRYAYSGALGPRVLGVPVVVPLAWAMMAYPALLVGRRVAGGRGPGATAVGALALAGWDVFLDPQMVRAGYWSWHQGGPALNGIPLTNHAGWLAVSVLLVAALQVLPRGEDDRLPLALYLWTYGSSLLANLAFFHRPAVALAGGLAMGVPTALLVRRLARDRPARRGRVAAGTPGRAPAPCRG